MKIQEADGNALIEATVGGQKVLFYARDLVGSGSVQTFAGTGLILTRRDAHSLIQTTSSDPVSVTVRPAAQAPIPVGTRISIAQMGAGQVTIVADDGVTINTPETLKLSKQYAVATLINLATNVWILAGYLEAA